MYATVNEASKVLAPLTDNITTLVWNIITKIYEVIDWFKARNEQKELMKIAESLKGEYPYESVEYVATIIKNGYGV